jgi:hypothetical protein
MRAAACCCRIQVGRPQILKNIKKSATGGAWRAFEKDCSDLGLVIHGDFILRATCGDKSRSTTPSTRQRVWTAKTDQVSIAPPAGTEFYDYAKANGFITNEKMEDGGGHQIWRTSSIRGCPPTT